MAFTTRPELRGDFGMVASTHWIATAVGMAVLERGGNAFDAAVAAGLTLQVVEPHLNGPGGELPALLWSAGEGTPTVLCGQGTAPEHATVGAFAERGYDLVPGAGVLAACVPGAFGAWMTLLSDYGTLRLADVLSFAIHYAETGHPIAPGAVAKIVAAMPLLQEWPSSAALYLPPPNPGERFRNLDLANTYKRILREARGGTREQEIGRAHDAFYRGFVAAAIHDFFATQEGFLTGDDLGRWSATYERPVTGDFHGLSVHKCGAWSQGPMFLQQLRVLEGLGLEDMEHNGVEYVHTVIESAKLAFADREAFYGDPLFVDVPLEQLLSREYAEERRSIIDATASYDLRPGGGRQAPVFAAASDVVGAGEPTRGDTVHLDIADRYGNFISATPSGGWLQSSPVVPGLGFPLGTRAQMFSLDLEHPNALAPGKRPRTTLSPSLATREGRPYLAFGTPGGDQQDQWSLNFFLAHVLHDLPLQQAIDAPMFDTLHAPSSFFPRQADPGVIEVEARIGDDVVAGLQARGHRIRPTGDWSLGRLSVVGRDRNGMLHAAADPRGDGGYAAGR